MDSVDPKIELDAVLDTMVDGVIMIDDRGRITRYNPACETIFQFTKDEVLGNNISTLMPEPYHSAHDSYIRNFQRSRTPKIIGIGRNVQGKRKNGHIFPMYLSVGETQQAGQTVYVGIIRDLTEERAQQVQFEKLQQQHFHLSRVAAMDQMGSAIAHEINQPLTSIINYLEAGTALLAREPNTKAPQLENIMAKASEQSQRAAQILSRLRRFIETGDVEKEVTDIENTIHTALDLVLPAFKNEDINISVDIEPSLPPVVVSDIQIQQVLVNLIRNGCEAMSNSPRKQLTITAKDHAQNGIEISVTDTGSGISDAAFEKLFDPFTTSKKEGLGVGLSISRTIISNHDGRLWAERMIPHGTCFHITLPRPAS